MNIKTYKILKIIILLLLIYAVLSGLSMGLFRGFMDFPCFVSYDKQNNCVIGGSRLGYSKEGSNNTQIESFLTVYKAGWSGGGCDYQESNTNTLIINTEVKELNIERINTELKINGKILEKGEVFKAINIFYINPWIISQLGLENLGLVTNCNSNSTNQRIIISGSYGTSVSLIKGFLILVFLILLLAFINHRIKQVSSIKKKTDKI